MHPARRWADYDGFSLLFLSSFPSAIFAITYTRRTSDQSFRVGDCYSLANAMNAGRNIEMKEGNIYCLKAYSDMLA